MNGKTLFDEVESGVQRLLRTYFGRTDGNESGGTRSTLDTAKLKRAAVRMAGVLVAAWLVSGAAKWLIAPSAPAIDADTQAYLQLQQAVLSGNYYDLAQTADDAYRSASDPELKHFCQLVARTAELSLQVDIQTFEEQNSWSGFLKGIVSGSTNPLVSLKVLALFLDTQLGGFEELASTIDSRYHARIAAHIATLRRRTFFHIGSWLLFFSLVCWGTISILSAERDAEALGPTHPVSATRSCGRDSSTLPTG